MQGDASWSVGTQAACSRSLAAGPQLTAFMPCPRRREQCCWWRRGCRSCRCAARSLPAGVLLQFCLMCSARRWCCGCRHPSRDVAASSCTPRHTIALASQLPPTLQPARQFGACVSRYTCAGVSTSAASASSESSIAEALRVVANHMGEQSRLQARLAALVAAELSRNATISETLIQIKQQMGPSL